MLDIEKNEIYSYANQSNISWNEDPTNNNILYQRNFIRHKILPQLKLHSSFLINDILTMSKFYHKKFDNILNHFDSNKEKYKISSDDSNIIVSKDSFKKINKLYFKIFVYWLFNKYFKIKFNESISKNHWDKCYNFIFSSKSNRKFILTKTYLIFNNRDNFIINISQPKHPLNKNNTLSNNLQWYNSIFTIKEEKSRSYNSNKNILYLNGVNGAYVRNWRHGDKIKYDSNRIKHKLLSNIFINNKLSINEKYIQPVVCDLKDQIIWIPGIMHGNIKIKNNEKILKILWDNKNQTLYN